MTRENILGISKNWPQFRFLSLVVLFSIVLTGTFGCFKNTASGNQDKAVAWNLSPEAEHLYYYLLLTEALADEDPDLMTESIYGLLKLDPSLPIFQDGVTLLLSRQKYEAASSLARRGLDVFPNDETLTVLLAACYNLKERPEKAISLLEAYLKRFPGASEASQELIGTYLRTGKSEEAEKVLNKMDSKDLTPAVSFFQSRLFALSGEKDKAKKILKELTLKYPTFGDAWFDLARIEDETGNTTAAIAAYQRTVQLTPDKPEIFFRIAQLQLDQENLAAALNTMRQVVAKEDYGLQAALLFSENGHIPEAELMVDEALKAGADPNEAALYLSTILYTSPGEAKRAIAPLEKIEKSSPFYAQARQRKAQLLFHLDDFNQAYEIAQSLRKAEPEASEYWGLEAYALVKMNKPREAEALLQEAIKKRPENTDLLYALGAIQDEGGKKAEAMRTMEKVVKIDPKHAKALNYIGYSLAEENKDLKKAEELVLLALQEQPTADYIIDSLAWVYYKQERYEEAWITIQDSLKLGKEDSVIWDHYGDIARALGKKEEAIKGYTEALKHKPDDADIIQEKLDEVSR